MIFVVLGFAAFFATAVIRAVVPQLWLLRKPLSCDLCMSWWSGLVVTLLAAVSHQISNSEFTISAFASGGCALLLTKFLAKISDV